MGRNTEIYMFNKDKASTNLYLDLKLNKLYTTSFEEFITRRKNELGNSYNHSYENILNTIKDDINKITADELFELLHYLFDYDMNLEKHSYGEDYWKLKEKEEHEMYGKYGILLLYELPTSTVCYSYMFQYGNYTNYYPIEEIKFDKDNEGENISSFDFLKFNDYMILTMKRIIDGKLDGDGNYYLNDNEMTVLNKVIIENEDNKILHQIIEKEFNWIKSYFESEGKGNEIEENTVYRSTEFLSKSIELKSKIDPIKNTRVVIVDSC